MREREPADVIERALVRVRRDQQTRRLQRAASGASAASSASAARFRYLDALDGVPDGLAISAVGEAIGVDRPRASRLTAELVTDGLVVRRPDPEDSRYAVVRLTREGEAVVAAMRATRRAAVVEALAGFSAADSQALATLLERFVDAWPRGGAPGR